jgi:hypothetical protein
MLLKENKGQILVLSAILVDISHSFVPPELAANSSGWFVLIYCAVMTMKPNVTENSMENLKSSERLFHQLRHWGHLLYTFETRWSRLPGFFPEVHNLTA